MWMAVTQDEYEMPIATGETAVELSTLLRVSPEALYSRKSKGLSGRNVGYYIILLEGEDYEMKYDILAKFRAFLEEHTTSKNTASRYFYIVKKVLRDISFGNLADIDPEEIEEGMKILKSKNDFSAAKRGLLLLQDFDPGLQLPKTDFFMVEAKKKCNRVQPQNTQIEKKKIMRKVNSICDEKLKMAYRIMRISGLRVSETAALRPEDIMVEHDRLRIFVRKGKGNKSGFIEGLNSPKMQEAILEYVRGREPCESLFYSAQHMKNEAVRLGMECHDLRRLYAQDKLQEELEKGCGRSKALDNVRENMRHSKVRTTLIYLEREVNDQ